MTKDREMGWADVIYKYRLPIVFILAFIVMLICSPCSLLRKSTSAVDVNCFIACAKYMWDGKVVYRDFFEQKGLVLYLIYCVIYLFPNPFHGAFLVELVSIWVFLFYADKTLGVITSDEKIVRFLILVIVTINRCGLILIGTYNQTEGYSMPIIMYVIYLMTKYILKHEQVKKYQWFLLGLFSGLIFWAKFPVLIYAVPIFLVFLYQYIKEKQINMLGRMMGFGVLGFAIVSIFAMGYFVLNGAVKNLVDNYFIGNIFGYSDTLMLLLGEENTRTYVVLTVLLNHYTIWFLIVAIILFWQKDGFIKCVTFCFIATVVVFCSLPHIIDYYTLALLCWHPVLCIVLYQKAQHTPKLGQYAILFSYLVVTALLIFVWDYDHKSTAGFEAKQNEWVELIEESGDTRVATINGMDHGFYYRLNYYPNKYYFTPVTVHYYDIVDSFVEDIESGDLAWVICFKRNLYNHTSESVDEVLGELEFVDEYHYDVEEEGFILYKNPKAM